MATVVIVTPYPTTSERLFPSPDLATGNTVEWTNVVGGVEADVEVYDDGRYSAAPGVTSFDWRVSDGEWGAWATQTIVDLTNTYEHSMSSGVVSGSQLTADTGVMNYNEHSLDSGISSSTSTSEDFGSGSANQYDYSINTALTIITSLDSDEGDAALNQNDHTMSSTVSGVATFDSDSGGVILNEYEFSFPVTLTLTSALPGAEGNSGGQQFMDGILLVRPFEFIPAQESRFLPRNPSLLGDLLPGSSNQLAIKLVTQVDGVESPADLSSATQVRVVIGDRYLISQVAGEIPVDLEWGVDEPGVIFINPQLILDGGFAPGTYSVRVEVFLDGEPDYFVFPTDTAVFLTLSL
jgi:hypothetical protein